MGGVGRDVNQLAKQDSVPNTLTWNKVKDCWTQDRTLSFLEW